MSNPLHNNYVRIALIGFLLIIIFNKFYVDSVVEGMTSRLGSPGMTYSAETIPINNGAHVKYRDVKTNMLNKLDEEYQSKYYDTKEFFNGNMNMNKNEDVDSEGSEESEAEYSDRRYKNKRGDVRRKYLNKRYNINNDMHPNGIGPNGMPMEEEYVEPKTNVSDPYNPHYYSEDEHYKRMLMNKNKYNTSVYPEPVNNRPDLGNCKPCKPCKPCKTDNSKTKTKTVVVHKLSPELINELKKELFN
jgi:hypothetical protein